jgi:hypothetical protein
MRVRVNIDLTPSEAEAWVAAWRRFGDVSGDAFVKGVVLTYGKERRELDNAKAALDARPVQWAERVQGSTSAQVKP